MGKPVRMILRGAFVSGWTDVKQEEKNRVFDYWLELHDKWDKMGAKLITTIDDEFHMVGSPGSRMWNFYEIYEIPTPEIVKELLDLYRIEDPKEIRLDKYFRIEIVIGYPIISVEKKMKLLKDEINE